MKNVLHKFEVNCENFLNSFGRFIGGEIDELQATFGWSYGLQFSAEFRHMCCAIGVPAYFSTLLIPGREATRVKNLLRMRFATRAHFFASFSAPPLLVWWQ